MRDDYKLRGTTEKLELEIEKPVADKLTAMSGFSKHSVSELVNTAIKRFMASHKDFMPPVQPAQDAKKK